MPESFHFTLLLSIPKTAHEMAKKLNEHGEEEEVDRQLGYKL